MSTAGVNNTACKQLQTQRSVPRAQHPTRWYLEIHIPRAAEQADKKLLPDTCSSRWRLAPGTCFMHQRALWAAQRHPCNTSAWQVSAHGLASFGATYCKKCSPSAPSSFFRWSTGPRQLHFPSFPSFISVTLLQRKVSSGIIVS